MKWFINSTKETAGFNDNNNLQEQIDILNAGVSAHHISINAQRADLDAVQSQIDSTVNEINHINDIVHDTKNAAITRSNKIHDAMQQKGIQINNILKHQGNQDERIDEIEKGMDKFKELLRAAFNTITDLDNKVKALENQSMPKQLIPDEKPKQIRIVNSYADEKYANAFKIAMGYWVTGMKQYKIAEKLNAMNIKTPTGKSFHQGNVSDLLANRAQKARFMEGKEKKAKL